MHICMLGVRGRGGAAITPINDIFWAAFFRLMGRQIECCGEDTDFSRGGLDIFWRGEKEA